MGKKKVKISNVKRSHHLRTKKKYIKPTKQQQLQQQQQQKQKQQTVGLQVASKVSTTSSKRIFGKAPLSAYQRLRKKQKVDAHKNKKKSQPNGKLQQKNILNEDDERENIQSMIDMMDGEDNQDEDDIDGDDEEIVQNDDRDDVGAVNKKRKLDIDDQNKSANYFENEYAEITAAEDSIKKSVINLLPIKSRTGDIIPRTAEKIKRVKLTTEDDVPNDVDENGEEHSDDNEDDEDSDNDVIQEQGLSTDLVDTSKNSISTADLLILREQEIARQKYRIGIICSGILEKPEDKMKNFTALFDLMETKTADAELNLFTIRKIATLSLLEVFKDILPEYRIGQINLKMQTVRKSTLERTTYENSLLSNYKKYLQKLENMTTILTKKRSEQKIRVTPEAIKLAETSVICLCDLLMEHLYFNFSQNIAQLLVYILNCNSPKVRKKVHDTFQHIFKNDKKLDLTLYIIRRLNHLVKSKSNIVHGEVLTCLMALEIKNINLDAEKEIELKQKKLEAHRARLLSMSKKEKKRQKRLQELDKEFQETKAEENKQTKQFKLTEITKMLFTIYFRILKNDPSSTLLSITLAGLAEFAHVINLDFFSDLVECLNNIMETVELGYREELHCIHTVFTILSGQGEILNIDPLRFYGHLYRNLLSINAGKNHSDILIILKTLTEVLLKRRKNINHQRLLAFVKRILTLSMHLLHNGTLGCLNIVKTLMQLTSSLDIIIDTTSLIGSGRYNPEIDDPEYCNANCTAAYEIAMLNRHYHPIVRKMSMHIGNGVPASGDRSLPIDIGKLSSIELYEQFNSCEMNFNPAVPPPKPIKAKVARGRHLYADNSLNDYCKMKLQEHEDKRKLNGINLDFYTECKTK